MDEKIDWSEYEMEPIPANETPRQFVLRMTGKDISDLAYNGVDLTWQEVKDVGALPLIERLVQVSSPPVLRLRKKAKP